MCPLQGPGKSLDQLPEHRLNSKIAYCLFFFLQITVGIAVVAKPIKNDNPLCNSFKPFFQIRFVWLGNAAINNCYKI